MIAAICLGLGFVLAGYAPNLFVFSAAHRLLIGVGAGTGFAPMMADISHWFVKRRGLAVVIVASGNYLAGAIWPLAMNCLHAADRLARDLCRASASSSSSPSSRSRC